MQKNKTYEKCVICGNTKGLVYSGYIFTEDGRELLGAAWCGLHQKVIGFVANPIFQNHKALDLFKKKHPKIYHNRIKNQKIIFLEA